MLQRVNTWVTTRFVMTDTLTTNQAPPQVETSALAPASPVQKGEILKTESKATTSSLKTDVFEFTDYRVFLKAFYEFKKSTNPNYSMSTFVRRAGLGENSRGYLKLVIEGKRNLTANTLRRFSEALSLNAKEALYFENLVYFNQAKTLKDREYYIERLGASAQGRESKQFELMKSKYQYWSNWYYVVIRELVGLSSFQEDSAWISNQLRNKISRRQAQDALKNLESLELIRRDVKTGKLVQSEPLVKHSGTFFNEVICKYHLEMMERAKEALRDDTYEDRSASSVTLSCEHSKMPEIRKAIADFRDELNLKFGTGPRADTVFQVNFQLFQFTPAKSKFNQPLSKKEPQS